MYLAVDPHLKIFCSRGPPRSKNLSDKFFSKIADLQAHIAWHSVPRYELVDLLFLNGPKKSKMTAMRSRQI